MSRPFEQQNYIFFADSKAYLTYCSQRKVVFVLIYRECKTFFDISERLTDLTSRQSELHIESGTKFCATIST